MPDFLNPNPIYDPRQWLNMSNLPDPQAALVGSPMQQQEEDPNSPEAFRKKLMQEIANRQQAQQPQDVQAILMDLISKRRSPDEEARLRQVRGQTPEDIQRSMNERIYGAPATSTLGKVGQSALKIAAGAFGVAPNVPKAALEQYKAQQTAANSEESIDQRMTAAQANAISAMQKTRQQADAADQNNKMKLFSTMTTDALKQRQQKLAEAELVSKTDLRTAQAMKMKADADYREKNGLLEKMFGAHDTAGIIQWKKLNESPESAAEYAGLTQASQEVKNTSKDRPASGSTTLSPLIVTNPVTGLTQDLGTKKTQTFRPAVSGGGNKNALLEAMGLSPIADASPQAPQQSGVPQAQVTMPRQPQIAPRPSVAPQTGTTRPTAQMPQGQGGQFEQVGMGGPQSQFGQALDTQYNGKKYRMGNGAVDAWAVPNSWRQVLNPTVSPPKLTTAQTDAKAALDVGNSEISNLNAFLEDASKKGQAQMLFNNPRGFINNLKPEWAGKTGALAKWGANPDISQLQSSFELMQSGALSRKIFALSGKASSEKEAQRFEMTLPNKLDPWDVNLSKSFYGTVMGPAMTNLAEAGLLHGSTAGPLADAAQALFKQRNEAYLSYVKNIAQRGGVETSADTAALKRLKDPNLFQVEVLQRAFPQHEGKDLVIEEPDKDRKIHIYIPKRVNDKEYRGTKSASIEDRIKNDPAYRKKLQYGGNQED